MDRCGWRGIARILLLLGLPASAFTAWMISATGYLHAPHYGLPKMILSTMFVTAGLLAGGLRNRFGMLILLGLLFSWWGDYLLLGPGDRWFLAGLLAFLFGHLSYSAAYLTIGVRFRVAGIIFVVMAVPGFLLAQWFWPGVSDLLRPWVVLYMVVITAMVAMAWGAVWFPGGLVMVLGACMFYLSDIGVATSRFTDFSPHTLRKMLSACYFLGQLVLAVSIRVSRSHVKAVLADRGNGRAA